MRQLPPRPQLAGRLSRQLARETAAIEAASDQKREAEKRYRRARLSPWFQPLVQSLREMSRPGQRCMFCSGNEASDVEHFRPKAVFPTLTLDWNNLLWACAICNRSKRNRFPPDTEPGAPLLNPVEENAWSFFFIDGFGNLTPRWRVDLNDFDPRAVTTRDLLNLHRQTLQESRQSRLLELKHAVDSAIRQVERGELSRSELQSRLQRWRESPLQPDVADFFLNGPGRQESPFRELFATLEARPE